MQQRTIIAFRQHKSLYTKSPDPPFPWDWRVWPARLGHNILLKTNVFSHSDQVHVANRPNAKKTFQLIVVPCSV